MDFTINDAEPIDSNNGDDLFGTGSGVSSDAVDEQTDTFTIPDWFVPELELDFSDCPTTCLDDDLIVFLKAGIIFNLQSNLVKHKNISGKTFLSLGGLLTRFFLKDGGGLKQRVQIRFLREVMPDCETQVEDLRILRKKDKISNTLYTDLLALKYAIKDQFPLPDGTATKMIPLVTPGVALGIAISAIEHVSITKFNNPNKKRVHDVLSVCKRFWETPVVDAPKIIQYVGDASSGQDTNIINNATDGYSQIDVIDVPQHGREIIEEIRDLIALADDAGNPELGIASAWELFKHFSGLSDRRSNTTHVLFTKFSNLVPFFFRITERQLPEQDEQGRFVYRASHFFVARATWDVINPLDPTTDLYGYKDKFGIVSQEMLLQIEADESFAKQVELDAAIAAVNVSSPAIAKARATQQSVRDKERMYKAAKDAGLSVDDVIALITANQNM